MLVSLGSNRGETSVHVKDEKPKRLKVSRLSGCNPSILPKLWQDAHEISILSPIWR